MVNMTKHTLNIECYRLEGSNVYIGTEKTRKLWKEIKPWLNGAELKSDAPEEIKAKLEEFKNLMDEEEERQIRMM